MPAVLHHPLVIFPPLKFTTVFRSRMPLGAGGCFFFTSAVDNTQPLAYSVLTMKTNSDKVFAEVLKQDCTLERFTAAEIAHYLLKQAGGKLAVAIERARNPYRIGGKAVW